MLYLVNSIPHAQYSKEEKLNFAYNLFDEEDSRVITYLEVKKILIANYFACSYEEIENKAIIIFKEAKSSQAGEVSYDDYCSISKKNMALFFPINI